MGYIIFIILGLVLVGTGIKGYANYLAKRRAECAERSDKAFATLGLIGIPIGAVLVTYMIFQWVADAQAL